MSDNLRPKPGTFREGFIAPQVVVVDGLPGCGKTMLAPIISALPRVQLLQYAYEVEYVCALRFLNKLDEDAARDLVRLFTDLKLYNVMMSRDVNFRPSDISSAFRNVRKLQYLRRLFQQGDEAVMPRISKEKPILQLTTHNILPFANPLFSSLESRGVLIEVLRHPLYMIRQQIINHERYGQDPRMFTLCIDYKGKGVPYFAHGWEELYLNANAVERAIYMIQRLTQGTEQIQQDIGNGFQVLEIPFEQYVLDPWPYMKRIEALLNITVDKTTRREMKKQKVPRQRIADGLSLKIYKKYGWKPPLKGVDEADELEIRRKEFAQKASPEAMSVLDQMGAEYEKKFF